MSTPPLGLRERNHIRTRDEILVATSELLGERGYVQTTIEDVASRAGVSRGTIYTYFPDGRRQLVLGAYTRMAEIVATEGAEGRARATSTTDRIVALATALVNASVTPAGRFYGLIGPEVATIVSSVRGATSGSFREYVRSDLEDAVTAGRLPADTPIDALAVSLTGSMAAVGAAAAEAPDRADDLLRSLRILCDSLLGS